MPIDKSDDKTQSPRAHASIEGKGGLGSIRKDLAKQQEELEGAIRSDDLGEAIEHLPAFSHDSDIAAGFHITSIVLATGRFFGALNAFLKGEKISTSRALQLAYAGILVAALAVGFIFPPVGLALGVAMASITFGMSAFRLIKHGIERWQARSRFKKLEVEKEEVKQGVDKDVHLLEDLEKDRLALASIKDDEKRAEAQERITNVEAQIRGRAQAREKVLSDLGQRFTEENQTRKHLLNSRTALRAFSVLTASLGLAGAIMLLFPAVAAAGGALLVAGLALVGAASLAAGLRYIKKKWFTPKPVVADKLEAKEEVKAEPHEEDTMTILSELGVSKRAMKEEENSEKDVEEDMGSEGISEEEESRPSSTEGLEEEDYESDSDTSETSEEEEDDDTDSEGPKPLS